MLMLIFMFMFMLVLVRRISADPLLMLNRTSNDAHSVSSSDKLLLHRPYGVRHSVLNIILLLWRSILFILHGDVFRRS